MSSDIRTVEVFNMFDGGRWNKIDDFESLKYGDIYRMYEPDTEDLVKDEEGNSQFVAQSTTRLINNTPIIDCVPLTQLQAR